MVSTKDFDSPSKSSTWKWNWYRKSVCGLVHRTFHTEIHIDAVQFDFVVSVVATPDEPERMVAGWYAGEP